MPEGCWHPIAFTTVMLGAHGSVEATDSQQDRLLTPSQLPHAAQLRLHSPDRTTGGPYV